MIWLKTIRGKAKNATGTLFSMSAQTEKRFQMALKDLFGRSYQAMIDSPAIRKFAGEQ